MCICVCIWCAWCVVSRCVCVCICVCIWCAWCVVSSCVCVCVYGVRRVL